MQGSEPRPLWSVLTTLLHECAHSEPILRYTPGKTPGRSGHDEPWKALYRELVGYFMKEVAAAHERGEPCIGLDVAADVQSCSEGDMDNY